MNWDDLRVLAAVGKSGSFSGAAQRIGLSHSSVSRRMRALERSLGAPLFSPVANRLDLTPLGDDLVETALRVEEIVEAGAHALEDPDPTLRGVIRFTTGDASARHLLPTIERFCRRHPEIEIDLRVGPEFTNPSRSEVDVILRTTNDPPPRYAGKWVATLGFAVCASRELAARHPEDTPLQDYPWVACGDGMTDAWMSEHAPGAHITCRASTQGMVEEAVRAGLGIGHVASWGIDRGDALVRLRPPDERLDRDIWLLTHRDIRTTARVRAFVDFIANEVSRQHDPHGDNPRHQASESAIQSR